MRCYIAPYSMIMPCLLGLDSNQALLLLSQYHLTPYIVAQKEMPNVPQGTILQQNPAVGQKIKRKQSVFLVVSSVTSPAHMPQFIQKTYADIQRYCKHENSVICMHHIPHAWPQNTCFAQWPNVDSLLMHETPMLYISSGYTQPVIWPNFIGHDAQDVIEFLKSHDITPDIIFQYAVDVYSYKDKHITDQRPLPGSCVNIDNPDQLVVQLRIE